MKKLTRGEKLNLQGFQIITDEHLKSESRLAKHYLTCGVDVFSEKTRKKLSRQAERKLIMDRNDKILAGEIEPTLD